MSKISSKSIETFIAGGFTLIFFKWLVGSLCLFTASIIDGKPEWLKLIAGIACSSIGIALGVGLLVGRQFARRWVRFFLFLMLAGSCLIVLEPMLHIVPPNTVQANLTNITDLVVNLTILVLLCWNKPLLVSSKQE